MSTFRFCLDFKQLFNSVHSVVYGMVCMCYTLLQNNISIMCICHVLTPIIFLPCRLFSFTREGEAPVSASALTRVGHPIPPTGESQPSFNSVLHASTLRYICQVHICQVHTECQLPPRSQICWSSAILWVRFYWTCPYHTPSILSNYSIVNASYQ